MVINALDNQITRNHAGVAGLADRSGEVIRAMLDRLLQGQNVMIATNQIFMGSGVAFVLAVTALWFAPKPTRIANTTGAH